MWGKGQRQEGADSVCFLPTPFFVRSEGSGREPSVGRMEGVSSGQRRTVDSFSTIVLSSLEEIKSKQMTPQCAEGEAVKEKQIILTSEGQRSSGR